MRGKQGQASREKAIGRLSLEGDWPIATCRQPMLVFAHHISHIGWRAADESKEAGSFSFAVLFHYRMSGA